MGYEIWRARTTGERYLVLVQFGTTLAAAGPLAPGDDPRRILEARANQHHNPSALLEMHARPEAFQRELVLNEMHRAVPAHGPAAGARADE